MDKIMAPDDFYSPEQQQAQKTQQQLRRTPAVGVVMKNMPKEPPLKPLGNPFKGQEQDEENIRGLFGLAPGAGGSNPTAPSQPTSPSSQSNGTRGTRGE